MNSSDKKAVWIVAIIAGAVILMNLLYGLQEWHFKDGELKEFSDIARNFGLIALGVFGLPLAIWRSYLAYQQTENSSKQIELAERGQNIDRFEKATSMLFGEELGAREAGIISLLEIARNDPQSYYVPVMRLLCSFIRKESEIFKAQFLDREGFYSGEGRYFYQTTIDEELDKGPLTFNITYPTAPNNIRVAFDAVCRIRALRLRELEEQAGYRPKLVGAYLVGFEQTIDYTDFSDIDFTEANLSETILRHCVVTDGNFTNVIAAKAHWENMQMEHCIFSHTYLIEAQLFSGYIHHSQFFKCRLDYTEFSSQHWRSVTVLYTRISKLKLKIKRDEYVEFVKCSFVNGAFPDLYMTYQIEDNTDPETGVSIISTTHRPPPNPAQHRA